MCRCLWVVTMPVGGCSSNTVVQELAILNDASWRGIPGMCFHADQTFEPTEERPPLFQAFISPYWGPKFAYAMWECAFIWCGEAGRVEDSCSKGSFLFILTLESVSQKNFHRNSRKIKKWLRQRATFALLNIPVAEPVASRIAKSKEFQRIQHFLKLEPYVWPRC